MAKIFFVVLLFLTINSPAQKVQQEPLAFCIRQLDITEQNNAVQLQWTADGNTNIDHFEIERKDDSNAFKTIAIVFGSDDAGAASYSYKDKITVRDLQSSYRIKTITKQQTVFYSEVKIISLSSVQQTPVKIFADPSGASLTIKLPEMKGYMIGRIYNSTGQMICSSRFDAANPIVKIDIRDSGVYFAELFHPQTGKRYYGRFSRQ
ncbi:MAG: hypothetical protein K2X48_18030 [Chitinophagaceae bacterium]|nr:hypothetical protein [Chitinophagaceae bacterium]